MLPVKKFRGRILTKGFKWVYFVSRRLSRVDRKGRTAVTSTLASLGVCFGVMALIVVMSVMNGFQMNFIDAIMEVNSYHLRAENVSEESEFLDWTASEKNITSVTPFYEAQGLMVGTGSRQTAALIRALPPEVMEDDAGFKKELSIISGRFNLKDENSIILGNTLAKNLGVHVGSKVSILALSGSSDVSLLSQDRVFLVRGIFFTGYSDINSAYAFISLSDGERYFGSGAKKTYGMKVSDSNHDSFFAHKISTAFPEAKITTWRDYNRSFFGALRVEKNILLLLVLLIFLVVAVNIYNAMRRLVFERKEEIAVLSALGGSKAQIRSVFVMQGFMTGFLGALPGLLLGLFLSVNMKTVFEIVSKAQYYAQYLMLAVFSPERVSYLSENSMYAVYADIPARIFPLEVCMIFFFGIFSSLFAASLASRNVLKSTVTEVLRNE